MQEKCYILAKKCTKVCIYEKKAVLLRSQKPERVPETRIFGEKFN